MTRPCAVEALVVLARPRPASRRPVTSRMSWSRLLASSSGAKVRKLSGFSRGHVAQPARRAPGSPRGPSRPAPVDLDARSRASRAAAGRAAVRRRWRPGSRSSARAPAGTSRASSGTGRPCVVEQLLAAGTTASTASRTRRCSSFVRASGSGTWWARNVPSTCWPSTTGGQVQPFGVRSTIIGHAPVDGRVAGRGRSAWMRAMSSRQRVHAPPPSAGAPWPGSSPETTCGS